MNRLFNKFQWLMVLVGLVWCSCQQHSVPASTTATEDSLLQMVKHKIEEKKQLEAFRRRLPRDFFRKIERYQPIIRKYAKRYGFDWRLIVAQILKESRFREDALSQKGAFGLMQIMPYTAREITRELDIEYIEKDPRENITAGIYHLYKQLQYFPQANRENRLKLALAAYNGGPGHVFDAQDIARYLGMDPNTWTAVKACLPKLTSEYWKLHLEVWEQGVPNYGYFYGYDQTIDYVDDIFRIYHLLRKMFYTS